MDIEFDPEKDAVNQAKHGIPLAIGRIVLENAVADIPDPREYMTKLGTEERRIAYGLVAGRLFCCAYTMRGETYRLISARKANQREQRKWLP
jgi:uncharacterized DUF497 family protein